MSKEKNAKERQGAVRPRHVLVGTYKKGQLAKWRGWYNYPISEKDTIPENDFAKVNELWLFLGTQEQKTYAAEFVGVKTRDELIKDYGYLSWEHDGLAAKDAKGARNGRARSPSAPHRDAA